jgi:hypothetical protein
VRGGSGDEKAAHADRQQLVDTLKTAFAQGRLTKEEFELRVGSALAIYADLDQLTADIPAAPSGVSLPAGEASAEPARQLHNKRAIQRGTAAGTSASMGLTAALVMPYNAVLGVVLTVVVGVVMSVTLAGLQTLLWWALERSSHARAAPPVAGNPGYLPSAGTDRGARIIDEPGHPAEASRRRPAPGTRRPKSHRAVSTSRSLPTAPLNACPDGVA